MKADLDLIDDEPHKGGTTPTTMNPLILIPPRLKLPPASRRSLTVLIHDPAFPDGIDLSASSSHQDCVVVKSITEPRAHDIYPNTSIATIRIESNQNGEATIVVTDKSTNPHAPNIIAFGVDQANQITIKAVATIAAMVMEHGVSAGTALKEVIGGIANSIVASASSSTPTLVIPEDIEGMISLPFDGYDDDPHSPQERGN